MPTTVTMKSLTIKLSTRYELATKERIIALARADYKLPTRY